MRRRAAGFALVLAGASALAARAETPSVVYHDGLLAIRCADAPLGGLLEQVKAATGMDLILEGSAGSARLTADIPAQPVTLALPRLLEGTGINYLLLADGADPRRVATLYVGDAKAGPAAPAPGRPAPAAGRQAVPRRTPPPIAEPEPMPIPEAPAEPEPAVDEEDEAEPLPVAETPVAGRGSAPGAAGAQSFLDPFGRPIPMRGAGGRQGRAGRRGGADPQQER